MLTFKPFVKEGFFGPLRKFVSVVKFVSQILNKSLESMNHENSLFKLGFHSANKGSSSNRINVVCLWLTNRCTVLLLFIFYKTLRWTLLAMFRYTELPERLVGMSGILKYIDVNRIQVAQKKTILSLSWCPRLMFLFFRPLCFQKEQEYDVTL